MSNEIKDRDSIKDHIADVMQEGYRSTSIDALLCHPLDAVEMALEVAVRSGRISKTRGQGLARKIAAIKDEYAHALGEIDEICRAGMASRKRGDLKKDRV